MKLKLRQPYCSYDTTPRTDEDVEPGAMGEREDAVAGEALAATGPIPLPSGKGAWKRWPLLLRTLPQLVPLLFCSSSS
jgi:hypothetical protein